MHGQRAFSLFLITVNLTLLAFASGHSAVQQDDSRQAHAGELRFVVVHAHFGNNCAGYLYVSRESVR